MSAITIAVPLIKEFEGFSAQAYPDPLSGGVPWTIGYGSTRKADGSPWRRGDKITEQEAERLLVDQLEEDYLPPLQLSIPGFVSLNPWRQAALLSFGYNLGANFYGAEGFKTITACLRERRYDDVPAALLLYVNPGTNVEAGLKRRRLAEGELWKTPTGEPGDDDPIEMLDAFRYFKPGLSGQEKAIAYLDGILTRAEKARFAELYRDNPQVVASTEEDEHWFYAHLTGKWLPTKLREMRLHLMRGDRSVASVVAWSGAKGVQDLVHPTKDKSGSLRICPENIYSFDGIDDLGYDPGPSDGIGQRAIKMVAQYNVNNRAGLWIHADYNFRMSPGSAGCLVMSLSDFGVVLGWYRSHSPAYCSVDLGQGFLRSKGYELPKLKSS